MEGKLFVRLRLKREEKRYVFKVQRFTDAEMTTAIETKDPLLWIVVRRRQEGCASWEDALKYKQTE